MTSTPTPILELRDETPERPFLMLAGEKYHFALVSDLSVEQLALVQQSGRKFEAMGSVDEVTPELAREISAALASSMQFVMYDMPDDVLASLSDGERIAILQAFTNALSTAANPAAPSATTPPASPASTPVSTPSGT